MKLHYTITLLFYTYNVFCQGSPPKKPYTKLTYPELNIIWYEVNYDSTMISDTSDAYNSFSLTPGVQEIIDDNFLYSSFYLYGKFEAFTGTYITKRDLRTGKMIWKIRYGFPLDPRQEIVRLMYINKDGNLETINQVKREPYLTNQWKSSYTTFVHSKRIFDLETGEQIFHDIPVYNDSNYFFTKIESFSTSSSFFREKDSIRYFALIKDPRPDTFLFHMYGSLINYNSKKNEVVTNQLSPVKHGFSNMLDYNLTNPTRLNDNEFLFIEYIDENPEDGIMLRFTDKEMNVVEEAASSEDMGYATGLVQLHMVSEDQQRFLFFNSVPSADPLAQQNQLDILILDRNAKLMRKVELSHKYARSLEILEWNDDNSMIVIGNRVYGSSATGDFRVGLDVIYIDSEGKVSIVKTYYATDPLKNFTVAKKLIKQADKYLLKFAESSFYENSFGTKSNDYNAKAVSYMLVDAASFKINTSTNENISELDVSLYPNPSRDYISLDFIESFSGSYSIYDINGRLMLNAQIHNKTRLMIDISCLNTSTYYINLIPADSSQTGKTLSFVKI